MPGVRAGKRRGRPFMGVDGEGAGVDRKGRQRYMLLQAGNRTLYTGKELTTPECLDFLLRLPASHILVGFSFGYDTTQILRDLPADRIADLFNRAQAGKTPGKAPYTYWTTAQGNYAIEYLPRNYLRVARFEVRLEEDGSGKLVPRPRVIEKSARTVYETFGFFQSSFLKACQSFDVGAEHWDEISRQKKARAGFSRITPAIKRYCALECAMLAQLMERLRQCCDAAGIRPQTWAGAGKLASALHAKHGTITRQAIDETVPLAMQQWAKDAYYGGRFEVTRVGEIPGPVYEYDINSAYPSAMRSLPCLKHGAWMRAGPLWLSKAPPDALFIARVHFKHPLGRPLYGLPIRRKEGWLTWPAEGNGTYWSCELRAAEQLGAVLTWQDGWRYVRKCNCTPFDWIEPLYERRRALGKGGAGYPIKLGLNSLYGKMAQRIGFPRYGNFIHAGLITATTRATLAQAIALDPGAIVMLATDAVVSLRPLHLGASRSPPLAAGAGLPIGPGLGEWEASEHPRLFVVQPGLYWSGRRKGAKRKTRGGPVSVFARHMHRFEKAWGAWAAAHYPTPIAVEAGADQDARGFPSLAINLGLFMGLRLAHAQGRLIEAGRWYREARAYSYDYGRKRSVTAPATWEAPGCLLTAPWPGGPRLTSVPHGVNLEAVAAADLDRQRFDEQRDHVDLSPP